MKIKTKKYLLLFSIFLISNFFIIKMVQAKESCSTIGGSCMLGSECTAIAGSTQSPIGFTTGCVDASGQICCVKGTAITNPPAEQKPIVSPIVGKAVPVAVVADTKKGNDVYCGETADACKSACASGKGKYDSSGVSDGAPAAGMWICDGNAPASATAPVAQTKQLKYTLLESFPGFFQGGTEMTDLPKLILAIFKFGIWIVGIAGLFMIVVGGFMYMASAGNTSVAGSAKGIILDALLGIVAALGAFLIMYVINPELTKINIAFVKVSVKSEMQAAAVRTSSTAIASSAGGACKVMTSGPCSPESLKSSFPNAAEKMSMICNRETGGKPVISTTDLCTDGNSFSFGLFQINMITSGGSVGCNGSEIFSWDPKIWNKDGSGCAEYVRNSKGVLYCKYRKCQVINMAKYNECKAKLLNSDTNLQAASALFKTKQGIGHWKTSAGLCKVQ